MVVGDGKLQWRTSSVTLRLGVSPILQQQSHDGLVAVLHGVIQWSVIPVIIFGVHMDPFLLKQQFDNCLTPLILFFDNRNVHASGLRKPGVATVILSYEKTWKSERLDFNDPMVGHIR